MAAPPAMIAVAARWPRRAAESQALPTGPCPLGGRRLGVACRVEVEVVRTLGAALLALGGARRAGHAGRTRRTGRRPRRFPAPHGGGRRELRSVARHAAPLLGAEVPSRTARAKAAEAEEALEARDVKEAVEPQRHVFRESGAPGKSHFRAALKRRRSERLPCAEWWCRCGEQRACYPYTSDADYQLAHPAVKAITAWRKVAGKGGPTVHQASSPCGYRTRGKMAVGPAGEGAPKGAAVIGLFRRGTWQVVPSDGCAANHPQLIAAMAQVQDALNRLRGVVHPFSHHSQAPWQITSSALRWIELTVERSTSKVQLVLVWNGERGSQDAALEQLLNVLWPEHHPNSTGRILWHSIWVHWRDADRSLLRAIHSKRPDAWEQVRPAAGRQATSNDVIVEELDGLPFAFGPASFQQANLQVFEQILRDMKAALKQHAPPTTDLLGHSRPLELLELCGGVGVIGLSLAHSVLSWQESPGVSLLSTDQNPNCARLFSSNAQRVFPELSAGAAGQLRVEFGALTAREALCPTDGLGGLGGRAGRLGRAGAPDVLILDPPRRGLAHSMHRLGPRGGAQEAAAIRASSVRAVLYVACGHEAFMADADRLTGADPAARGAAWGPAFHLEAVSCYDMFPFTPHAETLGVFVRGTPGDGRPPTVPESPAPAPALAPRAAGAAGTAARGRRPAPKLQCQFHIGIQNEPGFHVAGKILGRGGDNVRVIAARTGAKLRLRGQGSGFREGPERRESADPLMLCVSAPDARSYDEACRLVRGLLQDIYEQYCKFCACSGRAAPRLRINMQEGPRREARKKD